jgi:thymidylate kinase
MAPRTRIVCLEGCHGVGKSSLLRLLEKLPESYDCIPEKFTRIGNLIPTNFITESAWIMRWFKKVAHMLSYGQSDVIITDRSPYSALMYCNAHCRELLSTIIDTGFEELRTKHDFDLQIFIINVNEDDHLARLRNRLIHQPERKEMSEDDAAYTLFIRDRYHRRFPEYTHVDKTFLNDDVHKCVGECLAALDNSPT